MTCGDRIEMLSSYKPVPGFQGGTVGQTAVTKIEKIRHGLGHYSFNTFCPICEVFNVQYWIKWKKATLEEKHSQKTKKHSCFFSLDELG